MMSLSSPIVADRFFDDQLGPVGIQDSHLSFAVIQAPDGTIRID
jgi:hypothetical protein